MKSGEFSDSVFPLALFCSPRRRRWDAATPGRRCTRSRVEIDKLSADLKDAQQRDAEDLAKYKEAQKQINPMNQQITEAHVSADKMQQALAEYKQRADQLAAIEGRFRQLRSQPRAADEGRPQGRRPEQPDGHPTAGRRAVRLRQETS